MNQTTSSLMELIDKGKYKGTSLSQQEEEELEKYHTLKLAVMGFAIRCWREAKQINQLTRSSYAAEIGDLMYEQDSSAGYMEILISDPTTGDYISLVGDLATDQENGRVEINIINSPFNKAIEMVRTVKKNWGQG